MSVLDTLITDRTNGDVQDRNDKGTYNATDINRVNEAAEYVAQEALDLLQNIQQYLQTMGVATAPIFHPYDPDDVDVQLPVIQETVPNLPDGYTELEYIQSSGTQYIDTGFKHNQNTRVVMKVQMLSASGNAWVFEGRISSSSASKGVFWFQAARAAGDAGGRPGGQCKCPPAGPG